MWGMENLSSEPEDEDPRDSYIREPRPKLPSSTEYLTEDGLRELREWRADANAEDTTEADECLTQARTLRAKASQLEADAKIHLDRAKHGEHVIGELHQQIQDRMRIGAAKRKRGWSNPEGDKFFARQRKAADDSNSSTSKNSRFFFQMMRNIGKELHAATGAFTIPKTQSSQPHILDLCMAPGGFLSAAMPHNRGVSVTAYSLPVEAGGHEVQLYANSHVKTKMLDITMLAADMGTYDIPQAHPDSGNFLPKEFLEGRAFDLVLCDGQVLRTHPRAAYREPREACRLSVAQLALGLEHLNQDGTMVVLLHKLGAATTIEIIHQFHRFSSVQLFKPAKNHAKRSSFYMVASSIQVEHPKAIKAVDEWKRTWKIATFGTDDEYIEHAHRYGPWAEEILEDFGPAFVNMGRHIWDIQAQALAHAPFIANSSARPQRGGSWREKST